jgi:hypothetical protein
VTRRADRRHGTRAAPQALPTLPFTGRSDVLPLALTGFSMSLLGFVLVAVGRRYRAEA